MTCKFKRLSQGVTSNTMILMVIAFIVLLANRSFFAHTLAAYDIDRHNILALALLPIGLAAATALLLGVLAFGRSTNAHGTERRLQKMKHAKGELKARPPPSPLAGGY